MNTLQATRIAVERDRVDLEIDLTPGVAVANQVISWIDADRDGRISPAEGDAYAASVLGAVSLDVDDRRHGLTLVERRFPTLDEMRHGVGTIRLTATAKVPPVSAGRHRVAYRNGHRPELSVYLVNALAPANAAIEITGQQRDPLQHELRLDYRVSWLAMTWTPSRQVMAWLWVAGFLTVLIGRRGLRPGVRRGKQEKGRIEEENQRRIEQENGRRRDQEVLPDRLPS